MIYHGSNHSFDDLERNVRRTTRLLRPHLDKFDSIVVTGVSGLVVGPAAALRLKKPLVVVRKPDDSSTHSARKVEGHMRLGKRALFVDDFVSSGETQRRVEDVIERHGARVVGVVAYGAYDGRTNDWRNAKLEWQS